MSPLTSPSPVSRELIRLDARRGEWVEVADLARHFSLTEPYVAALLDGLSIRSQCRVQRSHAAGTVLRATTVTVEEPA